MNTIKRRVFFCSKAGERHIMNCLRTVLGKIGFRSLSSNRYTKKLLCCVPLKVSFILQFFLSTCNWYFIHVTKNMKSLSFAWVLNVVQEWRSLWSPHGFDLYFMFNVMLITFKAVLNPFLRYKSLTDSWEIQKSTKNKRSTKTTSRTYELGTKQLRMGKLNAMKCRPVVW